jgi:hypothetical protein
MGFNPYGKHQASVADYLLIGAAVAVAIGLLLWGFLG